MIRKLSQNGFDTELAAELRTDEGAALAMKVLKQHFRPTEELFKRPYGIGASFSGKRDQVRQLQAWQEEFGWWGFGPEEFENALKEKPGEWMKQYGRLVMPVLVPYLDDWWAMLNALWSLVGRQHAYDVCAGLAFPRGTLQLTEPDKYPGHGFAGSSSTSVRGWGREPNPA